MTLILLVVTFAVLTVLGVSCRRARLELEEQLCECLHPVAAAVGFGADPAEAVPAGPVLTGIDGGRCPGPASARHGPGRHLRVVRAG